MRDCPTSGVFRAMTPTEFAGGPSLIRILCMAHAPDLGGVERSAIRLCRALACNAVVTLALGRADGPTPVIPGCRIALAPRARFPRVSLETLWLAWWMERLIRRDRPDVILCPGNSYTIIAVLMRLRFGRQCPPIVAKISNALERPDLPAPARVAYRLWCRIQGRLIHHFVAMTRSMGLEIARAMAVSPCRVSMIGTPVFDTDTAVPPPSAKSANRAGRHFIAIGRLARQKNFPLLVAAFARGRRAEDRLTILGEGEDRGRIQRAVRRHGLTDRVQLPGHIGDVRPALAAADALVMSSDYEGVPAVALEAMALGVPVVATDCCASMGELLDRGRRGRLVPRGSVAALANAITYPTAREFDPDNARAYALSHSVDRAALRYLQLFGKLAPQRCVLANDNPARAAYA